MRTGAANELRLFLRNAMNADNLRIYNLRQQLPRSCNVLRF